MYRDSFPQENPAHRDTTEDTTKPDIVPSTSFHNLDLLPDSSATFTLHQLSSDHPPSIPCGDPSADHKPSLNIHTLATEARRRLQSPSNNNLSSPPIVYTTRSSAPVTPVQKPKLSTHDLGRLSCLAQVAESEHLRTAHSISRKRVHNQPEDLSVTLPSSYAVDNKSHVHQIQHYSDGHPLVAKPSKQWPQPVNDAGPAVRIKSNTSTANPLPKEGQPYFHNHPTQQQAVYDRQGQHHMLSISQTSNHSTLPPDRYHGMHWAHQPSQPLPQTQPSFGPLAQHEPPSLAAASISQSQLNRQHKDPRLDVKTFPAPNSQNVVGPAGGCVTPETPLPYSITSSAMTSGQVSPVTATAQALAPALTTVPMTSSQANSSLPSLAFSKMRSTSFPTTPTVATTTAPKRWPRQRGKQSQDKDGLPLITANASGSKSRSRAQKSKTTTTARSRAKTFSTQVAAPISPSMPSSAPTTPVGNKRAEFSSGSDHDSGAAPSTMAPLATVHQDLAGRSHGQPLNQYPMPAPLPQVRVAGKPNANVIFGTARTSTAANGLTTLASTERNSNNSNLGNYDNIYNNFARIAAPDNVPVAAATNVNTNTGTATIRSPKSSQAWNQIPTNDFRPLAPSGGNHIISPFQGSSSPLPLPPRLSSSSRTIQTMTTESATAAIAAVETAIPLNAVEPKPGPGSSIPVPMPMPMPMPVPMFLPVSASLPTPMPPPKGGQRLLLPKTT